MRIGDSRSKSYQDVHNRKYRRRQVEISKLCKRLDKLVEQAERFKSGKTKAGLMARADRVRKRLKEVDN